MLAYHGTNKQCADQITQNGFQCKENDEHWLGNGIYFYLDWNLAEWWAKTPKKDYGTSPRDPVVIQADIDAHDGNTIDTHNLDDFNWLGKQFEEFKKIYFGTGTVMSKKYKEPQVRCAFFDWLHSEFECADVVIVGFQKNNATYISASVPYEFHMPYIEYQVCVFSTDLIKISDVIELRK